MLVLFQVVWLETNIADYYCTKLIIICHIAYYFWYDFFAIFKVVIAA